MKVIPKIAILLAIAACCIYHVVQADTKILGKISIKGYQGYRDEQISLVNDKELVIEGVQEQKYPLPNNSPNLILKAVITYVGDKNGYRANFTLRQEQDNVVLYVNPSTLKSLGG